MLLNFIWYLDGRFTVFEADVQNQAEAFYNACFELISQPFKESQWTVFAVELLLDQFFLSHVLNLLAMH